MRGVDVERVSPSPPLTPNLFRALEVDASCWGYLPPGDTATGWKQVKRTGHRFPLHPRGSLAPTGCIIVNFHLKKQNSIHSCSISTHKSRFLEAVSLMSLQNKRQNQSFIQKHFKTNRSRPLFLLLTVACPTLIKFKNLEMTPAF